MQQFHITRPLLDEMAEFNACESIGAKSIVDRTFRFQNLELVVTASFWYQRQCQQITAYSVVPLEVYSGNLKPLKNGEHQLEVKLGRRKRGYKGQLVKHGQRQLVILDSFTFLPVEIGKQISLF